MDKWYYCGLNIQKLDEGFKHRVTLSPSQPRALAALVSCREAIKNLKIEIAELNEFTEETYNAFKEHLLYAHSWYKILMLLKLNSSIDLPADFNLHQPTLETEEFAD